MDLVAKSIVNNNSRDTRHVEIKCLNLYNIHLVWIKKLIERPFDFQTQFCWTIFLNMRFLSSKKCFNAADQKQFCSDGMCKCISAMSKLLCQFRSINNSGHYTGSYKIFIKHFKLALLNPVHFYHLVKNTTSKGTFLEMYTSSANLPRMFLYARNRFTGFTQRVFSWMTVVYYSNLSDMKKIEVKFYPSL